MQCRMQQTSANRLMQACIRAMEKLRGCSSWRCAHGVTELPSTWQRVVIMHIYGAKIVERVREKMSFAQLL